MYSLINEKIKRNSFLLKLSFFSVFLWGLSAHAYMFFSSNFSHDSLSEFYGGNGSNIWKIQIGRFAIPFYKYLFRTDLILPWLIGVLSLIWIALAVFLVIRIFNINSKVLIFLTAGIFATNITVSAITATYMHDLDCDMFAMMLAVYAVYLWKRYPLGFVYGAAAVAISLSLYQSYISVTIVLIMFVCILELLDNRSFKEVFTKGLKAIAMILMGGGLYYVLLQVVLKLTNITLSTGEYNSLTTALELTPQKIISLTCYAYWDCYNRLVNASSPYPEKVMHIIIWIALAFTALIILKELCTKRIAWKEKLLLLVLCGLLPLGMNITYILANGINHDLMMFALWLFYLLVLLLTDWKANSAHATHSAAGQEIWSGCRVFCMFLICVILYSNVQIANVAYLKKDLEQKATLSLWTRIVNSMESCAEYQPGITPVVFIGQSELLNDVIHGFQNYQDLVGTNTSVVVSASEDYRVRSYFRYVLNNPANISGGELWNAMRVDSRTSEMPSYPEEGSIALIDDVLVVKLGEN